MMSNEIEINWEAEDGYAGGSRPQTTFIDEDDIAESCETEAEAIEYIYQCVQEDFNQKISWYMRNQNQAVEAWRAAREKYEAENNE